MPLVYTTLRDPKDEKYLNLAIAANTYAVVTWDRDLLDLMTATATAFRTAHPTIAILTPPAFLALLAATP